MSLVRLVVEAAVAPHVVAGTLVFENLRVGPGDARLAEAMEAAADTLRRTGPPPGVIPAVRAMYHRFGVDPTRVRPSSEALLRRVRKGQSLPRINAAVDVCNWCSLETQLPFGLYDLERIHGDVELRVGRPGEGYEGIRKDRVNVDGRLTLADAIGPFGNPTSDSARTMVGPSTVRLLLVVFTPRVLGPAAAAHAVALTAARMVNYVGGREVSREVV